MCRGRFRGVEVGGALLDEWMGETHTRAPSNESTHPSIFVARLLDQVTGYSFASTLLPGPFPTLITKSAQKTELVGQSKDAEYAKMTLVAPQILLVHA